MSRNIVIYESRYGATKEIAKRIAAGLPGTTEVYDCTGKVPSLATFDTVILGGSIYMNKLQKHVRNFASRHEKELFHKQLGLFISCYTAPDTEGYFEQFFSPELIAHATASGILGGLMQYDKMNLIYRKTFEWLKKIDGFNENFKEPKYEEERIETFSSQFY